MTYDRYRQNAAECLDHAAQARKSAEVDAWLLIAEEWPRLAAECEAERKSNNSEDPSPFGLQSIPTGRPARRARPARLIAQIQYQLLQDLLPSRGEPGWNRNSSPTEVG